MVSLVAVILLIWFAVAVVVALLFCRAVRLGGEQTLPRSSTSSHPRKERSHVGDRVA